MRRFRLDGRVLVILIVFVAFPLVTMAVERGDVILSGGPVFTPILDGGFSGGDESVDYNDLFKNGWGLGMDGMFALSKVFRVGFGFSASIFRGDSRGGEDVTKWWVVPMMVGGEVFPLSAFKETSFGPYVRVDVGTALLSGVQVGNPEGGDKLKLFKTTAAFASDVGAGLEWHFKKKWGCFGEVRYMFSGHPYGGGDVSVHDPESISFLPIRLGITYYY